MKAIVIGAGKVGYHISEQLAREQNDVVLIDTREEALAPAREALDVLTLLGNGASPLVLEEAGVGDADMVIAVTTQDEVNIIACLTAKYYGSRHNGSTSQKPRLHAPRQSPGSRPDRD